jgi:MFS transporter, FSR family, fosmidomycin resistance protein
MLKDNEYIPVTVLPILWAISFVHLTNDAVQSIIRAIFPILKQSMHLSFTQIGLIGLTFNIAAGLLQPLIGMYTDVRPKPFLLPISTMFTCSGVVILALAPNFASLLLATSLVGIGSAIFHPEGSRVTFLAAGDKYEFAQSIFQTGGNVGLLLGPLLTVWIFVPLGQFGVIWFSVVVLIGIIIQIYVAAWYRRYTPFLRKSIPATVAKTVQRLSRGQIGWAMAILVSLVFSKQIYIAGIAGFYPFYLIHYHGISVAEAQWYLFLFLTASVIGTSLGGVMADHLGRRNVIWLSVLGTAPFSILLPFANLFWSAILLALIGLILSLSFSIIVVYGQELLPNHVGMVSGLLFGVAFGFGGIGAAALGYLADTSSIQTAMQICAYLPLIGLLTVWLPAQTKNV